MELGCVVVRVIALEDIDGRPVPDFGSRDFAIAPIAGAAHSSLVTLGPQGRIGRHPAAVDQLFFVLSGDAVVSGDDGEPVTVRPGQVASWRAGETHETRSDAGLVALVLEADGLSDVLR
jgi:quercetin dioxygenase-like cupin family protein